MVLLWMETDVWSLGFYHFKGLIECHVTIFHKECHDDYRASTTTSFAMHVCRVLLHVNLLMNKIHASACKQCQSKRTQQQQTASTTNLSMVASVGGEKSPVDPKH
ncbi:hypothetical protein KXD40_001137 [Peronospora effusa]|nr:hypothetical protein KXD40_001137 [Peronospora effusa]